MRASVVPVLGLSIAALLTGMAAAPCLAQTQAEVQAAAAVPLDLSTSPTAVAVQAADAAKAAPAAKLAATDTESVTAQPQGEPQAHVVASTDAASLSAPNFKAKAGADTPLQVDIGANTVAGKVTVDNPPPQGGLLKANPSLAGGPKRSGLGLAAQF